jgi:hypothetical protein
MRVGGDFIMNLGKILVGFFCLAIAGTACAETPTGLMDGYARDAKRITPDFVPSAVRGKAFFERDWGVSSKMPKCESCHGNDLTKYGKHVITGKRIAPMSPAANPKRFTRASKVKKWFSRNCRDVVGRECTAGEKADLIKFFSNSGVKS